MLNDNVFKILFKIEAIHLVGELCRYGCNQSNQADFISPALDSPGSLSSVDLQINVSLCTSWLDLAGFFTRLVG